MSSSSVCQGLQSCLEPRVIEPRVLSVKLAPPGSNFPRTPGWLSKASQQKSLTNTAFTTNNDECGHTNANVDGCGWSFLQSLAETSQCNKTEKVYVHPTVNNSSRMLSAKGLEMCTESLGSESGSDGGESSDEVSLFESSSCFTRHVLESNTDSGSRRMNRVSTFPPPLTSITDLGGVQVRPHREDGRLILEAVTSPSPHPFLQAERSNGRLRLRLFEGFASDCDDDEDEVVDDDEGIGEEEEEETETQNQEEECVENVEDEDEDEMGMPKFARPSRCKESGNRDIFGDGCFELPSLFLCL